MEESLLNVMPVVQNDAESEESLLGGQVPGQSVFNDNESLKTEAFARTAEEDAKFWAERAEERREMFKNPVFQANIVYENYIKGKILSGQEKRRLRKEILHNAKKGRYNRMFKDEIEGTNKKFTNLND